MLVLVWKLNLESAKEVVFESNLAPGEDEVGSVAEENVEKKLIFPIL